MHSKLNISIIETLINILLIEEKSFIKDYICDILIEHYNLIKDLNYDFDEIIRTYDKENKVDLENELMYKKIKHFSKKNPQELIDLYICNISEYYLTDKKTLTTELLRKAIEVALIQTEEGHEKLKEFAVALKIMLEEEKNDYDNFYDVHMPYLVYPLCQYGDPKIWFMILELYLMECDFIDYVDYADACNYYFSTICDEKFVNEYIKIIKKIKPKKRAAYHYDIAEFLNSEKIDKFLFEELNKTKDNNVKENIVRILANRFNKEIIPYVLEGIDKGIFIDIESINIAICPLLLLEERRDEISKAIIEDVREFRKLIFEYN